MEEAFKIFRNSLYQLCDEFNVKKLELEYLEDINYATYKVNTMLNDLIDEDIELISKECDLMDLTEQQLELINLICEKYDIDIRISIGEYLEIVWFKLGNIFQIIINKKRGGE